jgi:CRISPR-associated protein Cas1
MNTPNVPDRDDMTSPQNLTMAWDRVQRNKGCAGGDNITVDAFERRAKETIAALSGRIRNGTYKPGPLRLHDIPKADGTIRRLAIPTVADRIVQTAVSQALAPHFEGRFHPDSYGYRPGRSVQMAVDRVQGLRALGYTHVVEADIDRAFDSFRHGTILTALADAGVPAPVNDLIGVWLEQFGIELGSAGKGLAQGSPLSPLLANIVLDGLDDAITDHGFRIVRFADDFLVLTRDAADADRALIEARGWLERHGLEMNPEGSRLVSFERGFSFLGKLFVMGMTLDEPEEDDRKTLELLREIAEEDAVEEAERHAGHDATARVLYLTEPGRRLSVAHRSFVVETEDGNPLVQLSHARVARIELGPACHVDEPTLRRLLATKTPLDFVDGRGELRGSLTPEGGGRASLHLGQARIALDPELATDLARRLVEGRIRNQRARLRVLARKDEAGAVAGPAAELGRILRGLAHAPDVAALRGFEGRATAVYLPALAALCHDEPTPFRRSRPARTPLNAAMNYLSALLERDIRIAVTGAGLHPGIGVLHVAQDGGAACVWDLMEGFRALLGEGLPVSLFRRRRLRTSMFSDEEEAVRITSEGRHALITGYEDAMARRVTSSHSGDKVGLRRLMLEEARALAHHVRDPVAHPFTAHRQDY